MKTAIVKKDAMKQYDEYVLRHGEAWVQGWIENWERLMQIKDKEPILLEERWKRFIEMTDHLVANMN